MTAIAVQLFSTHTRALNHANPQQLLVEALLLLPSHDFLLHNASTTLCSPLSRACLRWCRSISAGPLSRALCSSVVPTARPSVSVSVDVQGGEALARGVHALI